MTSLRMPRTTHTGSMAARTLFSLMALAAAVVAVRSLPDLRRYLKIRRM